MEGREAPRRENRWPETREGTLNPANLSTQGRRIADLARRRREVAFIATRPLAKLSREEPDAGNLLVRVCEGWGW